MSDRFHFDLAPDEGFAGRLEADLQFLLPRVLELSNIGKDWETAFAGEQAMTLPLFMDRKKAKAAGINLVIPNSRDAILFLDLFEATLDIPVDDLSEFKTKLQAVESNLDLKVRGSLLTQLDSIVTMQTKPSVSAIGEVFIRRSLQHRLAAIAIGLRLYEKRHGKLPSELKDLTDLSLSLEQLSPSRNQSFGYRLEGTNATLWGGSFRDSFAIPSEPPKAATATEENYLLPFWTWELRTK